MLSRDTEYRELGGWYGQGDDNHLIAYLVQEVPLRAGFPPRRIFVQPLHLSDQVTKSSYK